MIPSSPSTGSFGGLLIRLLPALGMLAAFAHAADVIDIGSNRQLFVDDHLIDQRRNVDLVLHQPTPAEIVIARDKPWEGTAQGYVTVFRDGDTYRMYYRCAPKKSPWPAPKSGEPKRTDWTFTAFAESGDGIHWTKPELSIVDYPGSEKNNLVWPTDANKPWRSSQYPGTDMFPFKDPNPKAKEDERYKALANLGEHELVALASPDGLHWKPIQIGPVISYPPPDPMMDPPSLAFWDPNIGRYVAYMRCWINYRLRGFRRSESDDFIHWSQPVIVQYAGGEVEHLYTNMTTLYERAPEYRLMFAKRFVPWRNANPAYPSGLSEIVLLTSRDGVTFDRRFMEPFLPPGPDPENWRPRGVMMGRGILETSPVEMSLYYMEHYQAESNRIRRAVLRTDGFVSVHAPWDGGEFVTRPFRFSGDEIEINYSTSVAGGLRVELLDESGHPIPGYRLEDCDEIFGDEVARIVGWRKGHDSVLNVQHQEVPYSRSNISRAVGGRAIRLRFVMNAAHLYSFRIRGS